MFKKTTIWLFIFALFCMLSGCDLMPVKPDAEIHAFTTEQAQTWANEHKEDVNARLYVIKAPNIRPVAEFLVGIGFDSKIVKSEKDQE